MRILGEALQVATNANMKHHSIPILITTVQSPDPVTKDATGSLMKRKVSQYTILTNAIKIIPIVI